MAFPAYAMLEAIAGGAPGAFTVAPATVNLWTQPISLHVAPNDYLKPDPGQVFGFVNGVLTHGTISRVNTVVRSGPTSLAFTAPASPAGPCAMQCNTPLPFLVKNQQYVITTWVLGDPSFGTVVPSVTGSSITLTPSGVVPSLTSWQRIQTVVSAGFMQQAATFVLAGGNATPNPNAVLYVSDIQIELGNVPSAYTDGSLSPQQSWAYLPPAVASFTSSAGGSVPTGGGYWAIVTLQTSAGESLYGPAVECLNGSNQTLVITPPVSLPTGVGATGWNIYYAKNTDATWYKILNVTTAQTISSYPGPGPASLNVSDTSGAPGTPYNGMTVRPAGAVAVAAADLVMYGATNPTYRAIGITTAFTNIKKFGALGNGVDDDTAAITLAYAAMPAGGTLYCPTGVYVDTIPRTPTFYILGDGPQASSFAYVGSSISNFVTQLANAGTGIDRPTNNTNSLAAQASCYLYFPGDRWHQGLINMGLLGQATAASWASGRAAYSSGVLVGSTALMQNVYVTGWDAGIVVDSIGGHWVLNGIHTQTVWYGIYSIKDFGDGVLFESEIQAVFACYANHSMDNNSTLLIRNQIFGALYGFYQEFNSTSQPVTTSGQVGALVHDNQAWFQNSRWYGTHLEVIACAYVFSEKAAVDLYGSVPGMNGIAGGVYTATPGISTGSIMRDCEWNQPVATWYCQSSPVTQTYGRPVDYGIVVGGMANCVIDGYFGALPLGWAWVASLQNTPTQQMGVDVPAPVGPQAIGNYALTVGNYGVGGVRVLPKQPGVQEGTATIVAGTPLSVTVTIGMALGGRILNKATPATPGSPGVKAPHGTLNATSPWSVDTQYILPRVTAQAQTGTPLVSPFTLVISAVTCVVEGYQYQENVVGGVTVMQAVGNSSPQTQFTITLIPTAGDSGLDVSGHLKSNMVINWKI